MPNYVTNRLEINADRETVQNVMDFLKGKTDEDSTPCYIDFNNIIPMPKDLLIEASTSGEFGMQYIIAQQRKPFNSQDDLKVIQWMEIQKEKVREEALQLGMTYLRNWGKYAVVIAVARNLRRVTGENTVILLGMNGLLPTGVQNGMPLIRILKNRTCFGLIRLGKVCLCLSKHSPRYFRTSSFNMPMRMKTLVPTWAKGLSEMEKPT